MAIDEEYLEVDAAFDEEAWDYLDLHLPKVAEAMVSMAHKGRDPARIRRHIVHKYGLEREAIAIRLEAAARHLLTNLEKKR